MSENKRFKVAVYDDDAINGFAVLDLHKPNSSLRLEYEDVYIGSKEGCEIVCKFGNSLAEENQQLKKELKVYRKLASCRFEVCDKRNNVTERICENWREL